jgi:D-serine deaminase-like pyridoxal phosphate-dependent protein
MHAVSGLEIKRLNDQHAFVSMPRDALSVGDVVLFGISHPCTAFDKWRVIPLVDNDYRITELLHTMF